MNLGALVVCRRDGHQPANQGCVLLHAQQPHAQALRGAFARGGQVEADAVIPHQPVSPIPSKTIIFGLLGGLVVGLAFVFGADTLDRSVRTVDQAEAVLGLPVLAAIPETKDSESKKASDNKNAPRESIKYRLVDGVARC